MSVGLLALLDDVTALIKASAAALDDIPSQIAKTSGKVSGIVIDDAAVTPKYVVGLDPKRELSVIFKIARKSLVNKILILGPIVLALGFFVPWIIQPLLMLGGAYLCFEGYEKVHSVFHKPQPSAHTAPAHLDTITPDQLEDMRVTSAVRTDFILSAEIIAITYANVANNTVINQIAVTLAIAVFITVAVYGFVGLIVKTDDMALYVATHARSPTARHLGARIVRLMPHFLTVLGYIGTAAMLWVGADIIVHGIPVLHHALGSLTAPLSDLPVVAWIVKATVCALGGIAVGWIISKAITVIQSLKTTSIPSP